MLYLQMLAEGAIDVLTKATNTRVDMLILLVHLPVVSGSYHV